MIANDRQMELNRQEIAARQTVQVASVQATLTYLDTRQQVAIANAEAQVVTRRIGGYAAAGLGIVLVIALAIVGICLATAYGRRALLQSQYIAIGVEKATLQPPPFVFVGGYMIDTRSGERARLREAAAVNRLLLQRASEETETALRARAAIEIARQGASTDGILIKPDRKVMS